MTHLQPGRENILALQARVGHGETDGGSRVGDFTISDLMPEALRQNLSRLIVGEVRGGEAAAMFEAMQAGTGTLSTTHSHSAESTIDRLASRVAQGGVLTIEEAYRQIAHNIHLFIYVRLVDETWKGGSTAALRLRDPPGHPGHRERPASHPSDLLRLRRPRPARRLLSGRRLRGRAAAVQAGTDRDRRVGCCHWLARSRRRARHHPGSSANPAYWPHASFATVREVGECDSPAGRPRRASPGRDPAGQRCRRAWSRRCPAG